jgi:hypothetical protein
MIIKLMPSNIIHTNNNILEFLNFMNNDINGSINSKYINYLVAIDNLSNNGSYEINQYENFINNTTKSFPNLNKLNNLINMAKEKNPINFHSTFCVYLWYWIYH